MRLFTVGYQGIPIETYVSLLQEAGVGIVVDVRETPWSFKRGFSKSPLAKYLQAAGIDYAHVRSAGNPSANRKSATSVKECLRRYRTHLRDNVGCLEELASLIRAASDAGRPACLTCYEKAPTECHRSVLLEFLLRRDRQLRVVHLGTTPH